MRVTLGMQSDNTANYLRETAESLMNAQQVVTTGKRINKPSDDVTLAGRAMSVQSSIRSLEQYQENNGYAKSVLSTSEQAVSGVNDQLKLLRNAASSAVDGALGDDDKTGLLKQVDAIQTRLLALADTTYLDKHIFSGYRTNSSPLLQTGGNPPFAYQGDPGAVMLEIAPGEKIQTNVTASSLFNLDGSAGVGTSDVFTVISQLKTAIQSGDSTTCSNLLSQIDKNMNNVLGIQADLGAREQRVSDNDANLTSTKDNMTQLLSNLQDVDMTQAIVDLQKQQNVYQAALAVASKVGQKSLVDYMT